jgi:predicted dienelactone hydrolase
MKMRRHGKFIGLGLGLVLTIAGSLSANVANGRACERSAPCDSNSPEACLYVSDLNYSVGLIDSVVLVDPVRNGYPVPLLIRYPIGVDGPRPIVIWNHGGAPSPAGNTRSEEWGNTLAAAGYVVIHPSRITVENTGAFKRECRDNGFNGTDECAHWLAQSRFGPQNTHFIIDNLLQIEAAHPALARRLDSSKIVVAGHSAGSTTVLANAGALQSWVAGGPTYNERDNRPIAFLATGPQGPMYAGFNTGFQTTSFRQIDRPFMFITGVGDETGEPSPTRVTGWLTSMPGNKVLIWDREPEAVHETMDIDKCDTSVRNAHCRWIASAGVGFLDAVVRERPEAQEWIASNALRVATSGAIEIHRR